MAIATTTCKNSSKRRNPSTNSDQQQKQPLLPGLHDHLAEICLSKIPPSLLYSVCRSWRNLLYSPSFPPFLSLYALLSSPSPNTNTKSESIGFFSFDPISSTWAPLPPPPPTPPLLLRHPSFIARHLTVQSVTLSGHLILLAATTHRFLPALSRPLIFNPISNQWRLGPTMSTPRRWCAAGSASGAVYVASGVRSDYSLRVARSAERWDLTNSDWVKVASLKDGKFSREAVEAVGLKGKLCMVNLKGNAAKGGVLYDVEKDVWEEMPGGLLAGWSGPAAAMNEEVIYAVDEASGVLREYNWETDCWKTLLESEYLKGAVQIAAGGGRICVVRSGGVGIAVVDVVAGRIWSVDQPTGRMVIAVHVLPRMSRLDS